MPFLNLLGHEVTLPVHRLGPPGAFLFAGPSDASRASTILLPRSEVPPGTEEGSLLKVFVHLDSEDRPIATMRMPKLTLGRVAFLEVIDVAPFGAFVDWGLSKHLLVPRAEQTRDMALGERYPVGLYLDDSGRLAGTMRVSEMLKTIGEFRLDEWVQGEAWRNEPEIGVFVILAQRFVGLLPAHEPHALRRGQAASFRIANLLQDGKVELSLRGHAHQEADNDGQKIIQALSRAPNLKVGDDSSPETIRALFGLSKKAFKRAAGSLLKKHAITIDSQGFFALVPKKSR